MTKKKTKKEKSVVENTSVIEEKFVQTLEKPNAQQVDNTTFKDLNLMY